METMIIAQKIEMITNKKTSDILDNQCRTTNKLKNLLVEKIRETINNGDKHHYADSYSLRNEITEIKKEHPYFYSVHSSPLKNVAFEEKGALNKYIDDDKAGMPKFHSFNKDGCSLLYDEPNKGVKIKNKNLRLSLGSVLNEEGKEKRLKLNITLAERVRKCVKVKTYRIKKEYNIYYLIVTMEVETEKSELTKKCIALDCNHKNFFVGMDNKGNSYEMSNLTMTRYFNDEIAKVQEKQSHCKHEKIVRDDKSFYYENSPRYDYFTKIIQNLYYKRHIQVQQALFTIGNWLTDNYDTIVVGNYRPNKSSAPKKRMRKKVLNESQIGKFRLILQYLCEKKGKQYIEVDEKGTTKKCCICDDEEHKDPDVREFTCKKCQKTINRDINSAINIGIKGNILSSSDYVDLDLSKPTYAVNYDYRKQALRFV